jgi:hypothetical protein
MPRLLKRHWKLAVVWALALIAVGSLTLAAQNGPWDPFLVTVAPTMVFGNDVGFRIDRIQEGIPVGTLVVRIDGRWVPAQSSTPFNAPR